MKYILMLIAIIAFEASYSQDSNDNARALPIPINETKKDVSLLDTEYVRLSDIAWLEGHWKGEMWGGEIEEIWSSPKAGAMMGMFRFISEGKVSFYEMMIIREVDNTIIMQLKHFHDSLKGWEEKDDTVDFPFVKAQKNKIWFEGYTLEKLDENRIKINVIIEKEKPEGVDFVYYRQ